jgi:anti-sigma B factor antagonist
MSVQSAKMWVMVGERFACVKIAGRANFSSTVDFRTLFTELRLKGYGYFVLDLSECALMDSSFLGLLAGLGLKMLPAEKDASNPAIELYYPNPRIVELLESLGVLHLFKVTDSLREMPPQEANLHAPVNPGKEEITRASLEAHQTLMALNLENVSRFKDVAAFLAEDLKKLKGSG